MGDGGYAAGALAQLGSAALCAAHFDRAHAAYREAFEIATAAGDILNVVRAVEGLGQLSASRGDCAPATRLLGWAAGQYERFGMVRRPADQVAFERIVAGVRAGLGETAFARAWQAGKALTLDEAAAEARAVADGSENTAAQHARAFNPPGPHGLTPREFEVLQMLAERLTDREIGDRLYISPRTVSKHVQAVLAKLGCGSRRAAAEVARRGQIETPAVTRHRAPCTPGTRATRWCHARSTEAVDRRRRG